MRVTVGDPEPSWQLVTAVMVALAILAHLLDDTMSASGWAVQTDTGWQLAARGWAVLLQCWPILIAGMILAWLLSEILSAALWERTRGRLLQRRLNEAQRRETDARRIARQELADDQARVNQERLATERRAGVLAAERLAWEAHIEDLQQQLDQERARADRAEARLSYSLQAAPSPKRRRSGGSGSGGNPNPAKG